MDYKVEFADKDGKSLIKSSTNTTGDGILMRSMLSLIKGTIQSQEDENMSNLRKLINENETDYFPAPIQEEIVEEM